MFFVVVFIAFICFIIYFLLSCIKKYIKKAKTNMIVIKSSVLILILLEYDSVLISVKIAIYYRLKSSLLVNIYIVVVREGYSYLLMLAPLKLFIL